MSAVLGPDIYHGNIDTVPAAGIAADPGSASGNPLRTRRWVHVLSPVRRRVADQSYAIECTDWRVDLARLSSTQS